MHEHDTTNPHRTARDHHAPRHPSTHLTHPDDIRVPGYRINARLAPSHLGERFFATPRNTPDHVVLHPLAQSLRRGLASLHPARASRDARRFIERVTALRNTRIPHTLPIIDTVTDASGWHWIVTPYLGCADGLITLEHLRALKEHQAELDGNLHHNDHADNAAQPHQDDHAPSSQLTPLETLHATTHLLTAAQHAHNAGIAHGDINPATVLIDKHGSLHIELYALHRLLNNESEPPQHDLIRREIRSIARIAYTAITGTLEVPDPYLNASRLDRRIHEHWDRWLDYALDPARGFDSAEQARAHLPVTGTPLPANSTRAANARNNTRKRPTLNAFRPWRVRSE